MGTEYSIFVKSDEVRGSEDLYQFLETIGASNMRWHPPTGTPDSLEFEYPGLDDAHVYNRRISSTADEAWEEYGYDFEIVEWVPFRHDDQAVRDAMFELAREVARRFPILLMYADSVLAKSDSPGELEIDDPHHPFLVDGIREAGETDDMRKDGLTFERMGIECPTTSQLSTTK